MTIKMQMFGIGLYQSFFHNMVTSLHIFHKEDRVVLSSTVVDGSLSFKDNRFYGDFEI